MFTNPYSSFGATELVVTQIAQLLSITLSVYVARRLLDRRSFASLGLQLDRRSAVDFVTGLVITLLMMGLIFAAELALGWLRFEGFAWEAEAGQDVALAVVLFLMLYVLVGWNEELMSRGYHLQTVASGTTLVWGWIISSTIFGFLHLANPHADLMAVAGIVLAGLFLGYAYIRTGRLWLSVGLHTGWNFFEGVAFGFRFRLVHHLTHISVTGPRGTEEFGPDVG
jgi:membrane protease YdiL (CAAX protease family)